MPPAVATTQRLRTPVIPTRPTFCAKAVYGNVLKTPPSTVDSAVRAQAVREARRPHVAAGHLAHRDDVAGRLRHRDQGDDEHRDDRRDLEVGAPKWNGVADPDPVGVADRAEVGEARRHGHQVPSTMPAQDRDARDGRGCEALRPAG